MNSPEQNSPPTPRTNPNRSSVSSKPSEKRPQLTRSNLGRNGSNSFDAAIVVSGGNLSSPRTPSSPINKSSASQKTKKNSPDIIVVGQGPGLRPRIQPDSVSSPRKTTPGDSPLPPIETPEAPKTPRSAKDRWIERTVAEGPTSKTAPGRVDTAVFRRSPEGKLVRTSSREKRVEAAGKAEPTSSPRSSPKAHNFDELSVVSSPDYFSQVPKDNQPQPKTKTSSRTASEEPIDMIDLTNSPPTDEIIISGSESDFSYTSDESDSEPDDTPTSSSHCNNITKTEKKHKSLSTKHNKVEKHIHYCKCRCNMSFDDTLDEMGITSRNERFARKMLYYGFRIVGLLLIWSAFARAEMLLRMAAYGSHGEFIFDDL